MFIKAWDEEIDIYMPPTTRNNVVTCCVLLHGPNGLINLVGGVSLTIKFQSLTIRLK